MYETLLPETVRICTDVFGNYVIQKLLELGTAEERTEIMKRLEDQVVALSLQMYGCRVIQKVRCICGTASKPTTPVQCLTL